MAGAAQRDLWHGQFGACPLRLGESGAAALLQNHATIWNLMQQTFMLFKLWKCCGMLWTRKTELHVPLRQIGCVNRSHNPSTKQRCGFYHTLNTIWIVPHVASDLFLVQWMHTSLQIHARFRKRQVKLTHSRTSWCLPLSYWHAQNGPASLQGTQSDETRREVSSTQSIQSSSHPITSIQLTKKLQLL